VRKKRERGMNVDEYRSRNVRSRSRVKKTKSRIEEIAFLGNHDNSSNLTYNKNQQ
jgi:hypothetical protein